MCVKNIAQLLVIRFMIVRMEVVSVLNAIIALKNSPVNQLASKRVPKGDHIESIDGYEQVARLLPDQIVIFLFFFKLFKFSPTFKQVLFYHLYLTRGVKEPNVLVTDLDKTIFVSMLGEIQ